MYFHRCPYPEGLGFPSYIVGVKVKILGVEDADNADDADTVCR
jgi:hypothetical protein